MGQFTLAAKISHITIIGAIIALMLNVEEKKNEFNSFFIRQTLGLHLSFHLLGMFISQIDSWLFSSALYIIYLIGLVYSITMAFNGKKKQIPYIGNYYQNFFKNI